MTVARTNAPIASTVTTSRSSPRFAIASARNTVPPTTTGILKLRQMPAGGVAPRQERARADERDRDDRERRHERVEERLPDRDLDAADGLADDRVIVPQSTTIVMPTNSRFVSRNEASRETTEVIRPLARSAGRRHTISAVPTATVRNVNPMSSGPIEDSANAWTEEMIPERVRKVPKIDIANAATASETFQTRSIPRFSCTTTECRYAVPTSQGSRLAFSTGSHAQ